MNKTAGNMVNAVAEISDVRPDAIKVFASSLRVGDKVFDVWGGIHALTSVRTLRDGTVSTKRDDDPWRDHWAPMATITIIRQEKKA